jgi:hypothetical protein
MAGEEMRTVRLRSGSFTESSGQEDTRGKWYEGKREPAASCETMRLTAHVNKSLTPRTGNIEPGIQNICGVATRVQATLRRQMTVSV